MNLLHNSPRADDPPGSATFPDTVAPQLRSVTGPATILPTQPSKPTLAINIRRSPLRGTPILTFLHIHFSASLSSQNLTWLSFPFTNP